MDDTTVPVCAVVPEGVDTTTGISGMTLETLDLMSGFFRTSNKSREVLECYREEACMGGSTVGRYCAEGYGGPCEEFYLHIACLTAFLNIIIVCSNKPCLEQQYMLVVK